MEEIVFKKKNGYISIHMCNWITLLVTWKWSLSVLSYSLQLHTVPWNSPGQNTGVGSLSFLQGIFPTQGWNPGLPLCRQILYQLSHQGNPKILEWIAYPFSRVSSWPSLLHCRQILYQLSYRGSPCSVYLSPEGVMETLAWLERKENHPPLGGPAPMPTSSPTLSGSHSSTLPPTQVLRAPRAALTRGYNQPWTDSVSRKRDNKHGEIETVRSLQRGMVLCEGQSSSVT